MDGNRQDLLAVAKRAAQAGQWAEASKLAQKAVVAAPNSLEAWLVLGIALSNCGDPKGSLASFKSVLQVDPNNFVALNWAGMLTQKLGDFAAAAEYAQRALRLQPNNPEPALSLGICLAKVGRHDEALPYLERAVKAQPNRPQYLYTLANVLSDLGRIEQAADLFERATQLEPTEEGFVKLTDIYISLGRPDRALVTGQKAACFLPNSARIQILLGRACIDLEDEVQASEHLDRALEIDPKRVEVYVLQGSRRQRKGDFQESERFYRKAIEVEPNQGISYFGIVSSRKVTENDRPLINQMVALAADPRMHPTQQSFILYGLGKSFDNLGELDTAIHYYDKANEVHGKVALRNRSFSAAQCHRETTQRINLYNEELVAKLRQSANKSDVPVFVLGMMRSGTTLLEQILSCHPEIGGAGELPHWASHEPWYVDFNRGTLDLPAIAKGGNDYVEFLTSKAPTSLKITDKNPANVMLAGLIHAALPNAKIVHTLRDPVDTALSMWITLVETPPNFCCDRKNIVAMYREYQRITRHWRKTLPSDRFLEVSYESLVTNPEPEIRRVLSFLELEWSELCLHPEENQRSVTTPSFWQVRQPLYGSSIARWKRYEQWIPEFVQLRDELTSNE